MLATTYVANHHEMSRNGEMRKSGLASKTIWDNQSESIATIFQTPTTRNRKPATMHFAQVVRMRIDLLGEVINPNQSPTVLVRQGQGRIMLAGRTRTLTGHVTNLILTSAKSADFPHCVVT
jgi:hypothetical protein